jgi:serpin B
MKAFRPFVAGVLVLATATACGSTPSLETLTAPGVQRQQPAAGAPVDAVARAIDALGFKLTTGAFRAGENSVVSPLSIAYAFAMLRAGAAGETARQLDQFFGFPANGLHDAFNAITRQLVTADTPPAKRDKPAPDAPPRPPVVCVGNALFPQHGYPIGDQFLRTLAAEYGTGVHPVDFEAGKATGPINDWARRQTAGRIKKVFAELPKDTRLVIANTVYLRADWPVKFEDAGDMTFTRANGTTVKVPMMGSKSEVRYAAGPDWQAVEVPYAGGQLAMRILLPAPGQAPGRLLAPDTMSAVTAALRSGSVSLVLPKWDFGSDLDLMAALRKLGLTGPLQKDADYSGINPQLYVGQAVHRANITVGERGTEAAAVTAIGMEATSAAAPKTTVVADRPFAFAIVHTGTNVPLFEGQVADPTAN